MSITLLNHTDYLAQYVVRKGQKIIARLPAIPPKASLVIPTDDVYEVIATTLIDGNTYTSAPISVSGSRGLLAQVLQVPAQGTYEFDVVEFPTTVPDQLALQTTCLNPVTFIIRENGEPPQSVVVNSSTESEVLGISNTFSIYAVIDGVTTATLTTNDPNATITAMTDYSALEAAYFYLIAS